ncbi:MAG: hypothetical protein CM1200mP22_30930 [Dehalococcoidia bacterium]|nr:MAG: hypothetical protein CM1200mP22_30930 [Dehalococcoidia bacterium]
MLSSPELVMAAIKDETKAFKKSFNNPRVQSSTTRNWPTRPMNLSSLTKDAIITLSQKGYVKRVPSDTFRTQHRGGKGVVGMRTREDDAVMDLVVVDTHDTLFFFTNRGRVYPLKAYQIHGDSSRTSRGYCYQTSYPGQR